MLPISLVSPAFYGLNKQAESSILGVEWATEASNCVFDSSGRLAARKGWTSVTSTPITDSPNINVIAEYFKSDGTSEIISAADGGFWKGTNSFTDVTGTATSTIGDNWQFVNFADKLYGVQEGEVPVVYDGTDFEDLTAASGTAPTGNCALAFAGRLWVADGTQVVQYSALLDATHWSTGAGSVDLTSVWPNGVDRITALATFNNRLIVFGRNSTIIFTDGQGSELGIDPENMYVEDVLGVGCIARDSVKEVEGEDLLFLSTSGVLSLQRLIQEKSAPISNVSKNNRNYLMEYVNLENPANIKAEFSPENNFYILTCPTSSKVFCFDTSAKLEDGSYRMTDWTIQLYGLLRTSGGTLYMSSSLAPGEVGIYSGYLDDGALIPLSWASGWLDLGQDFSSYLKILKNITATVFTGSQVTVALKWALDFGDSFNSETFVTGEGGVAEYGVAEYGIAEYSGGIILNKKGVNSYGTGQFIRLGLQTNVNNSPFAMQQITMFAKIGRLAK
jgi:hypothetical protein